MKKKSAVILFVFAPVVSIIIGAWLLTTLPSRAIQYIEDSPKTEPVFSAMKFMQIIDMPGYYGTLGRNDAKKAAYQGVETENEAWRKMSFFGFNLLSGTSLYKCVNKIHSEKIYFFNRASEMSMENLISDADVKALYDSMPRKQLGCFALALQEKEWAAKLWTKFSSHSKDNEKLEDTPEKLKKVQNTPEIRQEAKSDNSQEQVVYFSPTGSMDCESLDNTQCQRLLTDILPNGWRNCDFSMASGGSIIWGKKYVTSTGEPISLILRRGRGLFIDFIPSKSSGCSQTMEPMLSAGSFAVGEVSERHEGEEQRLALMAKGDTIYYAFENSITWNSESKQYKYQRVVYKIAANGPKEFYRQSFESSKLTKLDEAIPLKDDLMQQNPQPPALETKRSAPVPSQPSSTPDPAKTILAMLSAANIDNMSNVKSAKDSLSVSSQPIRGSRKIAREKNKEGIAVLSMLNFKSAIALFSEGITADPGDIEIMNNLGYALMMDGQLDESKVQLFNVLNLDIARSGAWANLGEVLAKMGDKNNAVAAFKLAYYFSRAPEKTVEFFKKLSETDADEKIRNSSAVALVSFRNIQPMVRP